jgi:very-short-patch-repair endonuclease
VGEVIIGSEAIAAAALTEYQLRRWHRTIFRDIYVPKCGEPSLHDRALGAWLWSRQRAVIAGVAASALHGAQWVGADTSIELVAKSARSQVGLIVRNELLGADEVIAIGRLPVTSVARTAFDLGRHLPRGQALARLDALMHATPFSFEDVSVLTKRYRGARGLRRLRDVLPLVDGGAASPKESWLRLHLIDAGLPKPTTQIPVHQGWRLMGVLDMGWEDYQVAVEYDGDQHRADRRQFVKDIDRLANIQDQGWVVIRVVAEHRPDDIIRRVYQALARRGYRRDRR